MIWKLFDSTRRVGFIGSILLFFYLTNPFNLGLYVGYLLIFVLVLKKSFLRRNLDLDFFILLIFSILYGLFYSFNPVGGIQYIIVYSFTAPFLYLWGKYLVEKLGSVRNLFFLLLTIGFIFSIAALISVSLDILEGGFVQSNRNIPMFWDDNPKNATGMGALFMFNMCIPAILLSSYNKIGTIVKVLLGVIFIISIACVLRLGSRTQLGITLITFLLTFIYLLPKHSVKQNIILFISLGVGIFLVYRNVSFDLDSDWLTSFAGRMEKSGSADIASGGGRTDRWVKSFENLFKKPLGWRIEEFGYSHNLWLDALRAGGVLSFLFLIIFSMRSFFQIKKATKLSPENLSFNVLVSVFFVAFFLLFMVEPILDGSFSLFVVFCMFMGIINKYSINQEENS